MRTNPRNFGIFIRPFEPATREQKMHKHTAQSLLNELREMYPELVRLAAEKLQVSTQEIDRRVRNQVSAWRRAKQPNILGFGLLFPVGRHEYEAA